MNRDMKVVVMDYNSRFGTHHMMGEFETTMQRFIDCKNNGGDVDEDAGFKLCRDGSIVGHVLVLRASTILIPGCEGREPARVASESAPRPEFLDYLQGGCKISLAVAIDFSASNGKDHSRESSDFFSHLMCYAGDPRVEGAPHYAFPPSSNAMNSYEKAIKNVGSILARYDNHGLIPTWGFGAKYGSEVQHCFQCGDEVAVQGVQGVLNAYREVFQTSLTMSYPTDLTKVIRAASRYAEHEQVSFASKEM